MKLIFKKIAIAILTAMSLIFLADMAVVYGVSKYQSKIDQPADAIIVLGAAINTPALYNRTLKGLELYENNKADLMVFSGGKIAPSDISEAEYMEQVVLSRSMQNVNYVLEEQSTNTYENIYNSQKIIQQKLGQTAGESSVIIVSDEYHLGRAVLLAKRAGFETVYWQAPQPDYYHDNELRYYYFRELVAMISYIPKLVFG